VELKQIVEIQIRRLRTQLSEAELTFHITEAAEEELANQGFDPAYGARPLKRVIQQRLANPLASALLERRLNAGDTVEIDWDGHRFTFTPAHAEAVPT
jgi:ATP-dependent Clp protease ATP-binding subunit ClpB